jgi:hypothetical protein
MLKFQKIGETERKLVIDKSNFLSKIDIEKNEKKVRQNIADVKNKEKENRRADFQKFQLNDMNKVYNSMKFIDKENNIQQPKVVKEFMDRNSKQLEKINKEHFNKIKEKSKKTSQTTLDAPRLKQHTCHSNKSINEIVPRTKANKAF